MRIGDEEVNLGVAEGNIFAAASSGRLAQQLLEARLQEELRRGIPKVSVNDVEHDWTLLQRAVNAPDNQVAARDARPLQAGSQLRWAPTGNRP
jgi:hypothetical protein